MYRYNESNESTVTNQLNSVQFEDSERSDTISFTLDFISLNSGFGFNNTNEIYTKHIQKVDDLI